MTLTSACAEAATGGKRLGVCLFADRKTDRCRGTAGELVFRILDAPEKDLAQLAGGCIVQTEV